MRISFLFAGMLLATSFHTLAERIAPQARPLPEATDAARVIVRFKDDAPVLRAHALSATASPQSHERALAGRAATLGGRHGMALRSGAAIGEREQVLHGPAGMTSQALADQLMRDADVAWAEPDRRVRRTLVPNDSLFAAGGAQGPAVGQWYLRAPAGEVVSSINAVTAWDTTTGGASVIVAVLDTGVRPDHPDLAGKLIGGYDMVADATIANDGGSGRDADPSDPGDWVSPSDKANDPSNYGDCDVAASSWHGTQVAGIIGAATNSASGMAGAGWDVRVLPVRVLGKCFGYTSDIAAGIKWAAGIAVPGVPANPNPAKVINLSLGSSGACSQSERDAIAAVNAAPYNAVVVAAAGNSAGRAAGSPANCPGAIGVAALRHVGSKVGFSDIGPELAIAAPGGNCVNVGASDACLYPILTTADSGQTAPEGPIFTDSFNVTVGTSFSSPLVAATAGLMFAVQPTLTPAALKGALQSSARAFPSSGLTDDSSGQPVPLQACRAPSGTDQLQCYCTTTTCGAGMLDAGAAVAAALSSPPTPTPIPTPTPSPSGGGGGGGSMSAGWLLSLAAAVAWLMRRPRAGLVATALLASAAAAAAPPPRAHRAAAQSVHGLIVQLRDAPTHASVARAHALTAGNDEPARAGERERWQRMVEQIPVLQGAQRRAVGESAQLLRFERPLNADQARELAAQIAQRPDVAWVEPNVRERRLQVTPPTDPLYAQQWWLQPAAIGGLGVPDFFTAWSQRSTGSASAIVAVLDNGIVAHPDLAGKVIAGYDMVSDSTYSNDGDGRDADPTDPGDWLTQSEINVNPGAFAGCDVATSSWHGTAITGIVVAQVNNGQGGASINWPGQVLAVRVAGKCGADVADIVDGMRWAAGLDVCANDGCTTLLPRNQNPARVINISFGGDGSCTAYQGAIDELRSRGVVVVAAAGNESVSTPTRPAKCPGVIGVAALNRQGFKSGYSNFGSMLTVATVGGDDDFNGLGDSGILAPGNDGDTVPGASIYLPYYGTSFSTPLVTGAVSLMLSVNANLTADQIEHGLRASARAHLASPALGTCSDANPAQCLCTKATCGAGILDVPQALAYAATATSSSGGGGGGAMSVLWLLALGTAVLALRRRLGRR